MTALGEKYTAGQKDLYQLGFNAGLRLDNSIEEDRRLISALKAEFEKGDKMLPYSKGLYDGIMVNSKIQDFRIELEERERQKWKGFEPDLDL